MIPGGHGLSPILQSNTNTQPSTSALALPHPQHTHPRNARFSADSRCKQQTINCNAGPCPVAVITKQIAPQLQALPGNYPMPDYLPHTQHHSPAAQCSMLSGTQTATQQCTHIHTAHCNLSTTLSLGATKLCSRLWESSNAAHKHQATHKHLCTPTPTLVQSPHHPLHTHPQTPTNLPKAQHPFCILHTFTRHAQPLTVGDRSPPPKKQQHQAHTHPCRASNLLQVHQSHNASQAISPCSTKHTQLPPTRRPPATLFSQPRPAKLPLPLPQTPVPFAPRALSPRPPRTPVTRNGCKKSRPLPPHSLSLPGRLAKPCSTQHTTPRTLLTVTAAADCNCCRTFTCQSPCWVQQPCPLRLSCQTCAVTHCRS
jgi:hypothetical protein